MKKVFLISYLLIAVTSFSQEKLLDYFVDNKGDTIYGMIRTNAIIFPIDISENQTPKATGRKFYLIEENKDQTKNLRYISHSLKKINCFKYKGKFFQFEKKKKVFDDGIYSSDKEHEPDTTLVYIRYENFMFKEQRQRDFIVSKSKDTIYGNIYDPLIGKPYLQFQSQKIKIDKDEITAYRYKNQLFRFKQKPRTEIFDKKEDFIRLLIDDKVKLYDDIFKDNTATFFNQNDVTYEREFGSNRFFFIEKNGEMIYMNPARFSIKAKEVFADCASIIEKLDNNYFVYEDLYSMVILYNYYLKHK